MGQAITKFRQTCKRNDLKIAISIKPTSLLNGSATDIPGGSGSYNYDEALQKLTLQYEADRYGNMPGTKSLKVEMLGRDKLILSYFSSGNFIYKTEYSRIN